jgi:hypothetical protein
MRRFASRLKCALFSGSKYESANCKSFKTMRDPVVKVPIVRADREVKGWTETTPFWPAQGRTRPAPFARITPGVASVHPLTQIEAGINTRYGTKHGTTTNPGKEHR